MKKFYTLNPVATYANPDIQKEMGALTKPKFFWRTKAKQVSIGEQIYSMVKAISGVLWICIID